MTMEPISNAAAGYQGSVGSVDNTQTKATVQMPERTDSAQQASQRAAAAEADGKNMTTEKVSDSSLKKAVEDINRKSSSTEAIFGYHEGTNRVTIKIIDKDTKQVKKEYPAEETLDMIQRVWEMAGLMVDERR